MEERIGERVWKQLILDEVIEPVRQQQTIEQARAEATEYQIAFDYVAACLINSWSDLESHVSKGYRNVEMDEYRYYLWSCQRRGRQSEYSYVKTIPAMKDYGAIGVIHSWTDVPSRRYRGTFKAPRVCDRIIRKDRLAELNARRAERKQPPVVVLKDPQPKQPVSVGWAGNHHNRDHYEYEEWTVAKAYCDKPLDKKHPWLKLTTERRNFYRGFFSRNVESRRAFLEEYGISRAIESMDGRLLDMDSTQFNGTRALYELDTPTVNAMVVSCSTTTRVYVIWVPKNVKTCAEADAVISRNADQKNCVGAA